ncbi:MAG: heme-binding protein [Flavobacteriales bacterium]|nr:heme-binding protein [Flavobacteriales bacterium]MBP7155912.1 heme-binding protein [Flavobacteriales bacterium]HQW41273.1 heme-binding protein [Flavobacteriales bacterium]
MKIFSIILIIVLILFVVSQIWAQRQVSGIETYPYRVVKTYDGFEVRTYERANFIYVTMDARSYSESSSKGFRMLAGYIFGGNDRQQKIAMTSPVVMEMDSDVTMKFLVPAQYKMDELPKPENAEVRFATEQERTVAAITFGGFANDEKILAQKDELFKRLAAVGIQHTGQWSFLGYDPPFKLFGRKNEVVVEVLP